MNKKKKRIKIIGIIAVIVIVFVVTMVVLHQNNENDGDNSETIDGSGLIDTTVNVETVADFVEPGKDTLEVDKIQGFTPKKTNTADTDKSKTKDDSKSKKDNNTDSETEKAEKSDNTELDHSKYILSDSNLTVEYIGSYTGNFLEDGSDDPIKNVASILITNNSDKMLQVGDIVFQVNNKETAKFRVTNLLPGTSVLVLEENRREYKDKDDYTYGQVTNAYLENPDLLEDKFEIVKENGKLTLKNKTKDTYKKVYVYYKYAQLGGAYMGGITYRVPFENIKGKASVDSVANHFNKSTSRIIDVQIAEQ